MNQKIEFELSCLVAELGDKARRASVVDLLARRFGAIGLIILVPDPQTGRCRPIHGLPQTLPGSARWRAFLRACRDPGEHAGTVEAPDGHGSGDVAVSAWTGQDRDVLIALGPAARIRLAEMAFHFRLAFQLFRAEFAASLAATSESIAQSVTAQSAQLLKALEESRVQTARKAENLNVALATAEAANAALQEVNRSLDIERDAAERAANIDALTGIASRMAFERRLSAAFVEACGMDQRLCLVLIDLDGFKEINDTRGHPAGDAILKIVGGRLGAACDDQVFAGRLGGDEFAVLLTGDKADAAVEFAERLQMSIRTPVLSHGEMLNVRCTIGLAVFPKDAATAEDLLRRADVALYHAKRGNKGALSRYTSEIEFLFNERQQAITFLSDALENNRVLAYYQPKVMLSDTRIIGFEALARIRDGNGAIRGPAHFWQALSDQESARRLGRRMTELVLRDLVDCRAAGIEPHPVSINVSGAEISRSNFASNLLAMLDAAQLDAGALEIEITETTFITESPVKVKASLSAMRNAGLSVALDDFGTGYSSLSHLLDWDVDCIKIDKSFIHELGGSHRATAVVRSVIELGRALNLQVVAEGVETVDQARFLRALGCPVAQGFLFGRPGPHDLTLHRHMSGSIWTRLGA